MSGNGDGTATYPIIRDKLKEIIENIERNCYGVSSDFIRSEYECLVDEVKKLKWIDSEKEKRDIGESAAENRFLENYYAGWAKHLRLKACEGRCQKYNIICGMYIKLKKEVHGNNGNGGNGGSDHKMAS